MTLGKRGAVERYIRAADSAASGPAARWVRATDGRIRSAVDDGAGAVDDSAHRVGG